MKSVFKPIFENGSVTFKLTEKLGKSHPYYSMAGIYKIDFKGKCIYIGEASNVVQRVSAHRSKLRKKNEFATGNKLCAGKPWADGVYSKQLESDINVTVWFCQSYTKEQRELAEFEATFLMNPTISQAGLGRSLRYGYTVERPSGEMVYVPFLNHFCKKHDLAQSNLVRVASYYAGSKKYGVARHSKNYKCYYATERDCIKYMKSIFSSNLNLYRIAKQRESDYLQKVQKVQTLQKAA